MPLLAQELFSLLNSPSSLHATLNPMQRHKRAGALPTFLNHLHKMQIPCRVVKHSLSQTHVGLASFVTVSWQPKECHFGSQCVSHSQEESAGLV